MARRGGGQGPQQPIRGFRPGKEPEKLRKQQAKQQFGELSPTQERLVELFAERTPEQARALVRRWALGLLITAIVLTVLAAALFLWSWVAGAIAGVLALVVFFLWWRLQRQREALGAMADAVSRRAGGKRRGR